MKLRIAAQLSLVVILFAATIGATWGSSASKTSSKVVRITTTTTTMAPTTTTTTETPTTTSPPTTVPYVPPSTTTTTLPYVAPTTVPQQTAQVSESFQSNSDIWNCIIGFESHGDPTAQNPTSTASGLFQFLDSSWKAYGGLVYASRAMYATVEQQWAIAISAQAQSGWWPWKGDGCTPVG